MDTIAHWWTHLSLYSLLCRLLYPTVKLSVEEVIHFAKGVITFSASGLPRPTSLLWCTSVTQSKIWQSSPGAPALAEETIMLLNKSRCLLELYSASVALMITSELLNLRVSLYQASSLYQHISRSSIPLRQYQKWLWGKDLLMHWKC